MLLFSQGRAVRPGRLRLGDAGRLRRLGDHGQGRRPRIRGRARARAQAPLHRRRRALQLRRRAQPGRPAQHAPARRPEDVLFALDLLEKAQRPRPRARGDPPGRSPEPGRAPGRAPPPAGFGDAGRPGPPARRTRRAIPCPPCAPSPCARCAGARGRRRSRSPSPRSTTRARRSGAERWWASCGIGHDAARERLAALAASPSPADRAWAARVAGEAARPRDLGRARGPARRSEPASCGAPPWPPPDARATRALVARRRGALGDRRLRGAAAAALCSGDRDVVEVLAPCLDGGAAAPVAPRGGPRAGPRARTARPGRAAGPPRLSRPDRAPRGARVAAASRYAPAAGSEEAAAVRRQLDAELGRRGLDAGRPARPAAGAGFAVLRAALAREPAAAVRRSSSSFRSSTIRSPSCARARAWRHGSREKRAYALEVLDVTVAADLKSRVLALLEDAGGRGRRASRDDPGRGAEAGGGAGEGGGPAAARVRLRLDDRVRAVRGGPPGGRRLGRRAGPAAEDASALVRETAAWARARLGTGGDTGGGGRMLTIERVICLKAVPMFAEVSDETLADVAELLGEVDYAKGQVVFEKGAEGDSLYMVISGRVRVYDGARTIVELGRRRSSGSSPCWIRSRAWPPSPPSRTRGCSAWTAIVRGADGGEHRGRARRPARALRASPRPRRPTRATAPAGQGRTLRIETATTPAHHQEVR